MARSNNPRSSASSCCESITPDQNPLFWLIINSICFAYSLQLLLVIFFNAQYMNDIDDDDDHNVDDNSPSSSNGCLKSSPSLSLCASSQNLGQMPTALKKGSRLSRTLDRWRSVTPRKNEKHKNLVGGKNMGCALAMAAARKTRRWIITPVIDPNQSLSQRGEFRYFHYTPSRSQIPRKWHVKEKKGDRFSAPIAVDTSLS